MALFDLGGNFKPRHVCGIKQSRFIEPHGCEDLAEARIKYANAEKLASNIEQIVIEHSIDLFDFCATVHHNISAMHKTINKPIMSNLLWQQVLADAPENQATTAWASNPQATKPPPPPPSATQAGCPPAPGLKKERLPRSKSTREERF